MLAIVFATVFVLLLIVVFNNINDDVEPLNVTTLLTLIDAFAASLAVGVILMAVILLVTLTLYVKLAVANVGVVVILPVLNRGVLNI